MVRNIVTSLQMRVPIAIRFDDRNDELHIGSYTLNEPLVRQLMDFFLASKYAKATYKKTQKNKFKFIIPLSMDEYLEFMTELGNIGYTITETKNLGTIMR